MGMGFFRQVRVRVPWGQMSIGGGGYNRVSRVRHAVEFVVMHSGTWDGIGTTVVGGVGQCVRRCRRLEGTSYQGFQNLARGGRILGFHWLGGNVMLQASGVEDEVGQVC